MGGVALFAAMFPSMEAGDPEPALQYGGGSDAGED